ncbi:Nucleolar Complex 2 protein [Gonapodya sp. JEL0774]|nr:Nucleolar Complex 2 protein [Gonapodya sp. JEL0774]
MCAETADKAGVFVPLAAYLTDVLEVVTKGGDAGKGSSVKALEWKYVVKAGKQHLGTKVYLDALIDETAFAFLDALTPHARSIGFPEIAVHPLIHMRRFMKSVGGFAPRWKKAIQAVVDKVEANCKWVDEKRSKVEFSPLDKEKVRAFLSDIPNASTPLGQHYEQARTVRKKLEEQMEEHARLEAEAEGSDDDKPGSSEEDEWPETRPKKKAGKGKADKGPKGGKQGKEAERGPQKSGIKGVVKETKTGAGKLPVEATSAPVAETGEKKSKSKKRDRKNIPEMGADSAGEDFVGDVASMEDLLGERRKKRKKKATAT